MAFGAQINSASAEQNGSLRCEERAAVVTGLSNEYAEKPVSMGYTAQGTVLEILASSDGSWTMIETLPSGMTCLVASGDLWQGNGGTGATDVALHTPL